MGMCVNQSLIYLRYVQNKCWTLGACLYKEEKTLVFSGVYSSQRNGQKGDYN